MAPLRKLVLALPDLGAAGIFAWAWVAPLAWHRLTVGVLVLALMLEFLAIQAGPFIGNIVYGAGMGFDIRERKRDAVILGCVYLAFAALAGASFSSWIPFLICLWLFGVKVWVAVFGRDPHATGREREMRFWMRANCYFFGAIFFAMFVPLPKFGVTGDGADYGMPGQYEWANHPYEAVAAGFIYFALLALTRLRDLKPDAAPAALR